MLDIISLSIAMAVIGSIAAIYLAYKKESKLLWIPIIYFVVMEALQAFTYLHIESCSPVNQLLTYWSYLHIAFQPFFINAIMLYFIPKNFRRKIYIPVFSIAFFSTILMLTKLYPFDWAGTCSVGGILCGKTLCSVSGNFHLAWNIPFNSLQGIFNYGYLFSVFIVPFIYGSWKVSIYNIISGPVLAYAITTNPNEFPAVWCLLSIAYIIIAVMPPKIRNKLKVKKWYFWKYPK